VNDKVRTLVSRIVVTAFEYRSMMFTRQTGFRDLEPVFLSEPTVSGLEMPDKEQQQAPCRYLYSVVRSTFLR
jgi:hypothetical protein